MPNLFTGRRAAGFASHNHALSASLESLRQLLDLGALPAAIEPFEGDEFAAMRGGHVAMIAGDRSPAALDAGALPMEQKW